MGSRRRFIVRRCARIDPHRSLRAHLAFLRARFFGTFAPERRACESPIAIACLRLVTFFPDRPLRNVPRLRSCTAFLTLLDAFRPYRRAIRIPPAE
jgi:hypothetical protein